MTIVCQAGIWHGQRLGIDCPNCGVPDLVVDQHFCRIVCFTCWHVAGRWEVE